MSSSIATSSAPAPCFSAFVGSSDQVRVGTVPCKSNYGHWVVPQTVDFYTADLYLTLLSDRNDNANKHKKVHKLQL